MQIKSKYIIILVCVLLGILLGTFLAYFIGILDDKYMIKSSYKIEGTVVLKRNSSINVNVTSNSKDNYSGIVLVDTLNIAQDIMAEIEEGKVVVIEYNGVVSETFPPSISASNIEIKK